MTGLVRTALLVCGSALIVAVAAADSAPNVVIPDPARAWQYRDLTPVRSWLESAAHDAADRQDAPGGGLGGFSGADVLRAQAWLARREGDSRGALELIDRAVELAPDRPDLRVDRAAFSSDAIEDAGAFKSLRIARDVRRDLEHAVAVAPDFVDAIAALVAFHLRAPGIAGGDKQKAAELMARLGELAPARLQFREAVALADEDRYTQAMERLDRALSQSERLTPDWRILEGNWLRRLGRDDGALEAYRLALSAAPRHGAALFGIGRLAAESGRAHEAGIDALQRFLALPRWPQDPEPKLAWWHLGRIQALAGCGEKAQAAFRKALEIDPDWREPRKSLEELADTSMPAGRCG